MKLLNIVPQQILIRCIDLTSIGSLNQAWNFYDSILIIELLRLKKIRILGGDVIATELKTPYFTGDSWFYDGVDYEESILKAMDYIKAYHELNGEAFYYSFVISPPQSHS